jgi:uncharacterized membrane protein
MEVLAVLSVAAFLWLIMVTPKEKIQMIWLGMIAAMIPATIILVWLFPEFR